MYRRFSRLGYHILMWVASWAGVLYRLKRRKGTEQEQSALSTSVGTMKPAALSLWRSDGLISSTVNPNKLFLPYIAFVRHHATGKDFERLRIFLNGKNFLHYFSPIDKEIIHKMKVTFSIECLNWLSQITICLFPSNTHIWGSKIKMFQCSERITHS